MSSTRIIRKAALTALLAASLASCGGDSGAFDDGVNMTGHYNGNFTLSGQPEEEARLLVDSDGRFVLFSLPYLYFGEVRTHGNTFTAEADTYSFDSGFANGSDSTMSGAVGSNQGISGTFSGGGLGGVFGFNYSGFLSTLPTSMDIFTGSHPSFTTVGDTGSVSGTITLLANGNFSATYGNGCTMEGQVAVREVDGNLYSFSAELTSCPTNGTVRGMGYRNDEQELRLYGRVGDQPVLLSFEYLD